MSLLGLDLNATRVRAVRGPLGDYPSTEPIDPPRADLPLVLRLENRTPVLGSAGLRVCRKAPQSVWQNFLPRLGTSPRRKGDHSGIISLGKIDATRAMSFVFQHIMATCHECDGAVLAVPAYLSGAQIEMLLTIASQMGLPVLGSVNAALATALTAHAEQAWFGAAVVVDVDDQALTVATVSSARGEAQLLDARCLPQLNERAWHERMLNAIADCSILDSRWDPRESPESEQSLFDQLEDVLEAVHQKRIIKLTIKAPGRHQSLVLQPRDTEAFCAILRDRVIAEVEGIFASPWPDGPPGAVLLTDAAARLPGLVADLQQGVQQWVASSADKKKPSVSSLEDFGSGLLDDDPSEGCCVVALTAGAAARGAHAVAGHFHRGNLICGHLDAAAPLPLPQPLEAGPARLRYQGQDHLLGAGSFAIGRQQAADLVFDGEQWPTVSNQHCEIVYDHRAHMLCDRSREGTFVNEQLATQALALHPGDWIRLGPNGPVLRFLGHSVEMRTTA